MQIYAESSNELVFGHAEFTCSYKNQFCLCKETCLGFSFVILTSDKELLYKSICYTYSNVDQQLRLINLPLEGECQG